MRIKKEGAESIVNAPSIMQKDWSRRTVVSGIGLATASGIATEVLAQSSSFSNINITKGSAPSVRPTSPRRTHYSVAQPKAVPETLPDNVIVEVAGRTYMAKFSQGLQDFNPNMPDRDPYLLAVTPPMMAGLFPKIDSVTFLRVYSPSVDHWEVLMLVDANPCGDYPTWDKHPKIPASVVRFLDKNSNPVEVLYPDATKPMTSVDVPACSRFQIPYFENKRPPLRKNLRDLILSTDENASFGQKKYFVAPDAVLPNTRFNSSHWSRAPASYYNITGPLQASLWQKPDWARGGEAAEIGLYPDELAYWLARATKQGADPQPYERAWRNKADATFSQPLFYRKGRLSAPLTAANEFKNVTLAYTSDGRPYFYPGSGIDSPVGHLSVGNIPVNSPDYPYAKGAVWGLDSNHTPNYVYGAYVLTGSLRYLLAMQALAFMHVFNSTPFGRQGPRMLASEVQNRGIAWTLRDIYFAQKAPWADHELLAPRRLLTQMFEDHYLFHTKEWKIPDNPDSKWSQTNFGVEATYWTATWSAVPEFNDKPALISDTYWAQAFIGSVIGMVVLLGDKRDWTPLADRGMRQGISQVRYLMPHLIQHLVIKSSVDAGPGDLSAKPYVQNPGWQPLPQSWQDIRTKTYKLTGSPENDHLVDWTSQSSGPAILLGALNILRRAGYNLDYAARAAERLLADRTTAYNQNPGLLANDKASYTFSGPSL